MLYKLYPVKQYEACFPVMTAEFNLKTFMCKSGTYEL
jgi:hypothetical protein